MEVKVLGYKPYSFPNKQTGEIIEGLKLYIIDDYSEDDDVEGSKSVELNLPYEFKSKMQGAPAIYELNYDVIPLKGSKAKIVYRDIKKKSDLKVM